MIQRYHFPIIIQSNFFLRTEHFRDSFLVVISEVYLHN